jgi:subtilisin family serine protease
MIQSGVFSQYDRRRLKDAALSLASQVALRAGEAALGSSAASVLDALMSSDFVKREIDATRKRARKSEPEGQRPEGFRSFWSAGSAVLRVTRDGMRRLPDEIDGIRNVVPNRRVSLPPTSADEATGPTRFDVASSWGVDKIGALSAWGAYGTKGQPDGDGRPIKVAVLDTGADPRHPALQGRIVDFAEFGPDGEVRNSTPRDTDSHGTHVCGTIAAGFDHTTQRWIGVAPDVKIAAGMVLPNGAGRDSQILAGIDWALDQGVDVINMSLGGISFEPYVADIYTRAIINANQRGVPVVVAIGNDGAQTSGSPGNHLFALSVGATDSSDRAAGFSGGRTQVIRESNYLSREALPLVYSKPDLSAPGVGIRSTVPKGSGYAVLNGTSMATPHVAGAIALMLAATRLRQVPAERRAFVIQDLIVSSVQEIGEVGQDHRYGFGRVDVLQAIQLAKELGY